MRIDYLKLLAFGSFTDQEIQFSPKCGLHLIYGPNEAGKSTMLRAIADTLFGIPHNSPDGFLHNYGDLRIEAGLTLENGTSISFRRRKGTKNTVLDLNDQSLDERSLAPFTAGLSRSDFENMFGLDHLRLREGGQQLLHSGGSLGESLFEAASGLVDLRRIMAGLEKEADALFRPTARKPIVNSLANQYQEERRLIGDAELSALDFRALEKEFQEQLEALAVVDKNLRDVERRKTKLERIRRTKPVLTERQSLRQTLQKLGDLPRLPHNSGERYDSLADQLRQAEAEQATTLELIEKLEAEVAQLKIPEGVLQQEATIDQLQQALGQYRVALAKWPTLEQQIEHMEQTGMLKLKELRPQATDLVQAEQERLSLHVMDTVDELAEQFTLLTQQLDRAQEVFASKAQDLKTTRQVLTEFGPVVDTTQLQPLVNKIRAAGNLEELCNDEHLAVTQLRDTLQGELNRLTLWTGTLGDLVSTEFPLTSTITQFMQNHEELTEELRSLRKELKVLKDSKRALGKELAKISSSGDVPSEAELNKAREKRTWGWQLVLQSWLSGEPDLQGEAAFAGNRPLHQAYEGSVDDADRIADELRQDSKRAARKANLEENLFAVETDLKQRKTELKVVQEQDEALRQRWTKLWSTTGLKPLSPAEMLEWMTTRQKLVDKYDEMVRKQGLLDGLDKQIKGYIHELSAALKSLGVSPQETLADLVEQASDFCQTVSERKGAHKSITQRLSEQEDELSKADGKVKAASEAKKKWAQSWAQAMEEIGLPQTATVKVAQNFIAELRELFALLEELMVAEQRKEQLEAFLTHYQSSVNDVVEQTRLTFEVDQIPQIVERLVYLQREARSTLATRQEKLIQLDEKKTKSKELEHEISHLTEEISDLMLEAKCETRDELEEILARHDQAQILTEKIQVLETQLLQSGDGLAIEELETEAETVDVDSIGYDLNILQVELAALEQERNGLNQRFGVIKKEYEEKVQGKDEEANRAAEKSQETLALLAQEAERYLKFKLASLVLKKGIEHYREQNQDPVLKLAGKIFSQLTDGSFSDLVVDYDANENPVIRGVRAQEKVGVEGMSDGTQDQLYLALRLASIEHYLDQAEPMPLIMDDVLVNFDDFRSASALQALADLAERTQVIMFTHHVSILQMAQKVLPEKRLAIHILGEVNVEEAFDVEELQLA